MLVKLDHFPKDRGENVQKSLKPPPGSKTLPLLLCLDLWTGGSALSPVHFEVNGGQLPSRSSNIPLDRRVEGGFLGTFSKKLRQHFGGVFPGQNPVVRSWAFLGGIL